MTIGFNNSVLSLRALSRLDRTSSNLERTYQRLSTGTRINSAADDAAGLSLSASLNIHSRVAGQAIRNVNDGISALNIAQGGLQSLNDILQRQGELATQAASGILNAKQRAALNSEAEALRQEFNRIVQTTQFNGRKLLTPDSKNLGIQQGFGAANFVNYAIHTSPTAIVPGQGGTFTAAPLQTGALSNGISSVETADLNGDGFVDVIAQDIGGLNGIRVFWGDGKGGVSEEILDNGTAYSRVVTGDIDNDGLVDIVGYNPYADESVIFFSQGDGTFTQTVVPNFSAGGGPILDMAIADFDGDGVRDLVTTNHVGILSIYFLDAQGAVHGHADYDGAAMAAASPFESLSVGDVDNDGDVDLIVGAPSGGSFSVIVNDGGGGLYFDGFAFGAGSGRVIIHDFNNDGKNDFVLSGAGGDSGLWLGAGGGVFDNPISLGNDFEADGQLSLADLNADGILDIAHGNSIYFANGDGTFEPADQSSPLVHGSLFALADFDNDGATDILSMDVNSYSYYLFGQEVTTQTVDTLLEQEEMSLLSVGAARLALNAIEDMKALVSESLNKLGASQSRLATGLSGLQSSRLEYTAAASRITDIDVASETAELTKSQIRQRVTADLLGLIGQQSQIALQLLKI